MPSQNDYDSLIKLHPRSSLLKGLKNIIDCSHLYDITVLTIPALLLPLTPSLVENSSPLSAFSKESPPKVSLSTHPTRPSKPQYKISEKEYFKRIEFNLKVIKGLMMESNSLSSAQNHPIRTIQF
eukprot:Sdes_comp18737_c0_seq1m9096